MKFKKTVQMARIKQFINLANKNLVIGNPFPGAGKKWLAEIEGLLLSSLKRKGHTVYITFVSRGQIIARAYWHNKLKGINRVSGCIQIIDADEFYKK